MQSFYKTWFAFVAGLVVGGLGLETLHAQTAAVPAYVVANIESVQDQATYDKYRAGVGATQTPFGGKVIARTKAVALDASVPPEGNVLLIQFPSMANLQAWWNSPAYVALRPFREKATKSKEYAIEGLPPS